MVAREDTNQRFRASNLASVPLTVVFRGQADLIAEVEGDLMFTGGFEVLDNYFQSNRGNLMSEILFYYSQLLMTKRSSSVHEKGQFQ